jgi:hypothetical protein
MRYAGFDVTGRVAAVGGLAGLVDGVFLASGINQ